VKRPSKKLEQYLAAVKIQLNPASNYQHKEVISLGTIGYLMDAQSQQAEFTAAWRVIVIALDG